MMVLFGGFNMAELGRPKSIESPEQFENLAFEYIKWVKSNPVMKTITASFQGEISYLKVPHERPMTQYGLASYMGIGLSTLKDYGANPDFSAIFKRVCSVMTAHNIDGASSGDMSGTIIARIEGLADKTDVTTNGESINKPTINVGNLSDEQLRNLDTIIASASEAGTVKTESK